MRVPTWVAATLLCLAPATALSFDWRANAGLSYQRADEWAPGTPRDTQPHLDVSLALQLHGAIIAPTILSYAGGVGYARSTASANGAETAVATSLSYDLRASVLQHPTSPIKLAGYVARSDGRSEQKLVGDQIGNETPSTVGDQTSRTYGGSVAFAGGGTPAFALGFNHREDTQTLGSVLDHEQSVDGVNAGVSSAGGPFSLAASYRGEWSRGSYVSDDYQSHNADVIGTMRFEDGAEFLVYDVYYRRVPTSTEVGAFGSEINSFSASYRNGRGPGQRWTLGYSDSRAVATIDGNGEQTLSNSLQYAKDQQLRAPHYFLRGTAQFSTTSQERTGAGSLSASGATAGLQLWWYHDDPTGKQIAPGAIESYRYALAAGPSVGYLDPAGGSVRVGYGAMAHGSIGIPLGARRLNGAYDVNFGTDLNAQSGWSLTQTGNVNMTGPAGVGSYDVGLSLAASRRSSPVLGASASRSLSARGGYRRGRYSLLSQATLSNGTLPGTSSFVGDGLFIPTGFDTRQASIFAQAAVTSRSGFGAHVDGRFSESAGPGQPSSRGWDAAAGVSYRYAAFDVSIDDRISWYEAPGGKYTRNLIFVRISRSIGSRF